MRAGNLIMTVGVALVVIGAIVRFAPAGLLSWFGHLPGDIRIENERSSVFVPITSMIVVSVAGTIVLNLLARLFRGE